MKTAFKAWAIDTQTKHGLVKLTDFGDNIFITIKGCPISLIRNRYTARILKNLLKSRGQFKTLKVVKVKVTIESED